MNLNQNLNQSNGNNSRNCNNIDDTIINNTFIIIDNLKYDMVKIKIGRYRLRYIELENKM